MYLFRKNELKDDEGKSYTYKDDIDELLGKTMEYINVADSLKVQEIKAMVLETLQKSLFYCGKDAFRLMRNERKTPINMNVFETIMYCLSFVKGQDDDKKDAVYRDIQRLINSEEYRENIGNHRDSEKKLTWRLNKAEEIGMRYM